jgi:predicted dehydrogenase
LTIRVGLIGLGEVAQLMHLPLLADDPRWRIAGVSDVSEQLTEAMGRRYGADVRTTRAEELIRSPGIDVVFILTPDE